MRTLVSTFLVGVCLVAGPALAQQHPLVPSGMYTGSLLDGDAPARAYGRIRSGDIVDSLGWRSGKPATDQLYDDACRSSHPVFSCPGTP
jgi:phage tail protein X